MQILQIYMYDISIPPYYPISHQIAIELLKFMALMRLLISFLIQRKTVIFLLLYQTSFPPKKRSKHFNANIRNIHKYRQ